MAEAREESNNHAGFIWSVAELLRGDYKQSEYGRVILPLTVLRRLDCVLDPVKPAMLDTYEQVKGKVGNFGPILDKLTDIKHLWNVSPFDFPKLLDDPDRVADNLRAYLHGFSPEIRDIVDKFDFGSQITRLDKANLLYLVVSKFAEIDLHPDKVSNIEMGYLYEELIRRFSELSNETAGEHFTPREVIRLMVSLLFAEDDDVLSKSGALRTVYDPACGTGGMLSVAEDYVRSHNPRANVKAYYTVLSHKFLSSGDSASYGVKMPRTSWELVRRFNVERLPPPAQRRIADFLDRETERLDALIDKKRRLIDLLEEKRTATITHLTSDSSPRATQLSRLADLTPGYAFESSGFVGSGMRLLRGVNVAPGQTRWEDLKYWPTEDTERYRDFELRTGDIVFGMDRPWIGSGMRVAMIGPNDVPALLLQRVARLRALSGLTQDYLYAVLRSREFKAYFDPIMTGVSVPHISGDQVLGYQFSLPSIEQQKAIAAQIGQQSHQVTSTIDRLSAQLTLLAEYREALITAAVTGGIDVDTFDNDQSMKGATA